MRMRARIPARPCPRASSHARGARARTAAQVRYANGPVMAQQIASPNMDGGGGTTCYARYATEFRTDEGTRGGSRMEGTPAILVGRGPTCPWPEPEQQQPQQQEQPEQQEETQPQAESSGRVPLRECPASTRRESGFGCGVVALVSPHLEDGQDERARTPLANLVQLASRGSFYQRWQLSLGAAGGAMAPAPGVRVASACV